MLNRLMRKMIDAAVKSGAIEFINNLPKKFDTRLGKRFEDSVELSQGQWQNWLLLGRFMSQRQY